MEDTLLHVFIGLNLIRETHADDATLSELVINLKKFVTLNWRYEWQTYTFEQSEDDTLS